MALDRQNVTVPFVGGLSLKDDPKQVRGKVLDLQNATFDSPGQIKKRNGYAALGSALTSAVGKAVATYKDELIAFDSEQAWTYKSGVSQWQAVDECASVAVTKTPVLATSGAVVHCDGAYNYSTGLYCYAWETSDGPGDLADVHRVAYSIVDASTGAFVVRDVDLGGTGYCQPKVVSMGIYFLLFYCYSTELHVLEIDATDPTATHTDAEVTDALEGIAAYVHNYDVAVDSTGAWIVWANNVLGIRYPVMKVLTTDLVLSPGYNLGSAGRPAGTGGVCVWLTDDSLLVAASDTENVKIVVYELGTPIVLRADWTTIDTADYVTNMTGIGEADNYRLYVTVTDSNGNVTGTRIIRSDSANEFYRGVSVASKVVDGDWLLLAHESALQSTYFLAGRDTTSGEYSIAAKVLPSAGGGHLVRGSVPELFLDLNNNYRCALIQQVNPQAVNGEIVSTLGVCSATFEFSDQQESYNFAQLGDALHVSGGVLQQYDGGKIVESGFHLFPEGLFAGSAGTTIQLASVVATNSLKVNGTTFTAVASGPAANQFAVGTSDTETAANLAASINAANLYANNFIGESAGYVEATSTNDLVFLVAPNNRPIVTDQSITFTLTAVSNGYGTITCASVASGDWVSVNGVVFMAVSSGAVDNQFVIGASDSDTAENLADAISAALAPQVTASASAAVVTVYDVAGLDIRLADAPDQAHLVAAATSGNTFRTNYVACYEWIDNRGVVHRSAPSPVAACKQTGGVDDLHPAMLFIPTLKVTARTEDGSPVRIVTYRTKANGAVFFRACTDNSLGYNDVLFNDEHDDYVVFLDKMSDEMLEKNPQLYCQPLLAEAGGASVLENIAPPPCSVLCVHQNRVHLVDAENRLTIWYSHEVIPGAPVEFNDGLVINADPAGGDITALATLDEKLIVFKADRIFVVSGSGADQTGNGSTYSGTQLISSDAGCIAPKSVVMTPAGLMFQSRKGILLLDRSLSLVDIGADVEPRATAASPVIAATMIPDSNQIRFVTSDGNNYALVFDYHARQWSTFTNHPAVSACIFENLYTYIKSNGLVLQETTAYSDNGAWIPLSVTTGWINFAGLNGYQRTRRAMILGKAETAATLTATVYYDYSTSAGQTETYDISAAADPLQRRLDFRWQKHEAVQIKLIDSARTGQSPSQGVSLSALTFEIGVKRGTAKVGTGQIAG